NETRIEAIGFNPYPFRLAAYAISGMMAGLAGFLLAEQSEFVSPAFMTWQRSGDLIIMVMLGGMASLDGAILGALLVVLPVGALAPDGGRILSDGEDVTGLPMHAKARRGLVRSFQVTSILPRFTALENVALAAQSRAGSSFRLVGDAAREAALNREAMAALAT